MTTASTPTGVRLPTLDTPAADTPVPESVQLTLKALLEFEEAGIEPIRARLAERLGHAMPTVCQSTAKLERLGYVTCLPNDRRLRLTRTGRAIAVAVLRRHRLAEAFLYRVVGLDWAKLHTEAERWQHSLSAEVANLIDEQLGYPERTPYGTPIPPRDPAWRADTALGADPTTTLLSLSQEAGTLRRCTLIAVAESAQATTGVLDTLSRLGLRPGSDLTVWAEDTAVGVRNEDGREDALPRSLASALIAQHIAPKTSLPAPLRRSTPTRTATSVLGGRGDLRQ